jgi:hypothetical protein
MKDQSSRQINLRSLWKSGFSKVIHEAIPQLRCPKRLTRDSVGLQSKIWFQSQHGVGDLPRF